MLFPLWVARQIAGAPFIYPNPHPQNALAGLNFVPWRTELIDLLLDGYSTIHQYVTLGSGLDTRGYGEPSILAGRVWEVDTGSNIHSKKSHIATATLQSDAVTYVPAETFRTIRGQIASGPRDLIPTSQQFFFSKV